MTMATTAALNTSSSPIIDMGRDECINPELSTSDENDGDPSDARLVAELAKVKLHNFDNGSGDVLMKTGNEEVTDSPMSDVPNATPLSDATSLTTPCSPPQQAQSFLMGNSSQVPGIELLPQPQSIIGNRSSHNEDQDDDSLTPLINLDDDEPSSCPANRAMEAAQAIATCNEQLIREEMFLQQQRQEQPMLEQKVNNMTLTPKARNGFLELNFAREESFRTDNSSGQTNLQESKLFIPRVSSSGPNLSPFPARQHQPLSVDESYDAFDDDSSENKIDDASHTTTESNATYSSLYTFSEHTLSGKGLTLLSKHFVPPHQRHSHGGSALAGFTALLLVTCANYMLGPMRDAAALAVGVTHIPALTLASTVLALGSSVPVGWLFEAPDPRRRRVWKRMGLTRGETQGTSLALFYRVFAFLLLSYALGFQIVERFGKSKLGDGSEGSGLGEEESAVILLGCLFLRILGLLGIPTEHPLFSSVNDYLKSHRELSIPSLILNTCSCMVNKFGKVIYIMFFLVVHLMKLHSLSLIWGVTTEAMEYEESAEHRRKMTEEKNMTKISSGGGLVMMGGNSPTRGGGTGRARSSSFSAKPQSKSSLRLKRLAFVGFGGTLGGIIGSVIASFAAHILHLSGLLVIAAIMLEISANLSIELGRIMQRHWEEQMRFQSSGDLASLYNSTENLSTCDSSMKKSVSLGSMKRVASGSLSSGNLSNLAAQHRRDNISHSITGPLSEKEREALNKTTEKVDDQPIDDSSFKQRLLRGITTILKSRLLMAIFTYNALYASTSVLLSFQRAELVANRSSSGTSAVSNTAFLAKINTASSVAVFALQASGLGAYIANSFGQRGALALMPVIRLGGVFLLGYWHMMSDGKPPDLIMFLVLDEFTKVINFAVAKPVRENLWRGLSAEARYEAKPIVDTLANRWGGGSAAFLVSFINRITDLTGLGVVNENGERSIFGFPPVLLLCMTISAWWTAVSADVGNIRRKIDLELKKQQ